MVNLVQVKRMSTDLTILPAFTAKLTRLPLQKWRCVAFLTAQKKTNAAKELTAFAMYKSRFRQD